MRHQPAIGQDGRHFLPQRLRLPLAAALTDDPRRRIDLGLLAGIAYRNGGGKITESQALDLASANVYKLLGLKDGGVKAEEKEGHLDEFVVFEGSPLEIGARVRAVGTGMGEVLVYEYDE